MSSFGGGNLKPMSCIFVAAESRPRVVMSPSPTGISPDNCIAETENSAILNIFRKKCGHVPPY